MCNLFRLSTVRHFTRPILVACLGLVSLRPVIAQDTTPIGGTWRGHSVCAVPNSPCHDEANVYRFSEIQSRPNVFSCTASKIVDGKEVVMGSGEWTYDPVKHLLQSATSSPTVRLALSDHTLDGALLLPDGTVYRRIHLKKER